MPVFASGATPTIPTTTLWQWDTTGQIPVVTGFPANGAYTQTKTGLNPTDLQNFIGVPLQYYGAPPVPIQPNDIYNMIRFAEDSIEQQTSVLLCQTWVASPPSPNAIASNAIGISTNNPASNGMQVRGFDYDLEDAAYDFIFTRAQDSGWMYQTLRYRPVQSLSYGVSGSGAGFGNFNSAATIGTTAIKNVAFIYPLLNEFFRMPNRWIVEDRNFGLVRFVPATNVQMLPLFAMQLAFMGFAEDVPGAQWYQYTAGLTDYDYKSRFSFMKALVLSEAATVALNVMDGTISMGAESYRTLIDGLQWQIQYPKTGPFGPLKERFSKQRDYYMRIARNLVAGPTVNVI